MKKTLALLAMSALLSSALAKDITVKVTNLTKGMQIAPLLIITHPDKHIYNRTNEKLFEEGSAANSEMSSYLGNNTNSGGILTDITSALNASAQRSVNPKNGYLDKGQNISTTITNISSTNTNLTIVARFQPTNDGFIALNNQLMPTASGTYTYFLNAYDGGVDANNEQAGSTAQGATGNTAKGIPGVTSEGFIHIHRGNIGDNDNTGGANDISDYDMTIHRWLNPVAKVELTVSN